MVLNSVHLLLLINSKFSSQHSTKHNLPKFFVVRFCFCYLEATLHKNTLHITWHNTKGPEGGCVRPLCAPIQLTNRIKQKMCRVKEGVNRYANPPIRVFFSPNPSIRQNFCSNPKPQPHPNLRSGVLIFFVAAGRHRESVAYRSLSL